MLQGLPIQLKSRAVIHKFNKGGGSIFLVVRQRILWKPMACLCATKFSNLIGASLSEPHINGTAMRAIYGICIYVYMYIYPTQPCILGNSHGLTVIFTRKYH